MRRRDEVIVGLFITIAVVVAIVGTLWLAQRGFGKTYPEYAIFGWGSGLKQGQPVLLAGVQVGSVDHVELRRTGYLFVQMEIRRDYTIPKGSTATVITTSFFGDKAVAIKPTTVTMASIPPGDTLPVGKATPSIDELLGRLDTVSRGVAAITETFRVQMVQNGGIADLRRTIASAQSLIGTLDTTVAQQSRGLTETLTDLRRTLSAVDSASVDSTVRSMKRTSQNLAVLTDNLQHMTARLNTVAERLDSGQGTAGKLLNDPGLYYDVRDVMMQLDSLVSDIKQNPKRYINVSIF
ncbi:MAG TPA: MlaD family protein [Gemmatimonadaceae bacterium]|nr:MlaD family protein [Gemmatimonadaceae bacterium]